MKHIKTISGPYSTTTGVFETQPVLASETIYLGSFVRMGAGGIEAVDSTADGIDYIVRGFYMPDKTGSVPLENVDSSYYSSTYTTTAGGENFADDGTSDGVYALVEPVLPGVKYRVQLDDTRATTTGSDTVGYGISTANGRQIDESTAADSAQQLIIVGVPTDESDVVDVLVRESYLLGTGA